MGGKRGWIGPHRVYRKDFCRRHPSTALVEGRGAQGPERVAAIEPVPSLLCDDGISHARWLRSYDCWEEHLRPGSTPLSLRGSARRGAHATGFGLVCCQLVMGGLAVVGCFVRLGDMFDQSRHNSTADSCHQLVVQICTWPWQATVEWRTHNVPPKKDMNVEHTSSSVCGPRVFQTALFKGSSNVPHTTYQQDTQRAASGP